MCDIGLVVVNFFVPLCRKFLCYEKIYYTPYFD